MRFCFLGVSPEPNESVRIRQRLARKRTFPGKFKDKVTIPVKAYPAASTSQQIHFNQLHAGCGQRIRYEKHCPVHGKVEAGAIVSGYAYAPEQYVVIDQAELEPLRPPRSAPCPWNALSIRNSWIRRCSPAALST